MARWAYRLSFFLLFSITTAPCQSNGGTISMKGVIVKKTCEIISDDVNKTVDLGTLPTYLLSKRIGIKTLASSFSISLKNCSAESVKLVFSGDEYQRTGMLNINKNSSAKGIAVSITDDNGDAIPLGISSPAQQVDSSGNAVFLFKVNYVSVQENIIPGELTTEAQFLLNYD